MNHTESVLLIRIAKTGYVIVSLFLCVAGIFEYFIPGIPVSFLCYALGLLLAIWGILKITGYLSRDLFQLAFQYDLALGILFITVGLLMLLRLTNVMMFFYALWGVLFLTDGLFKIQISIDARSFGIHWWILILVLAIIAGVFETLLIIQPIPEYFPPEKILAFSLFTEGLLNLCVVLSAVKVSRQRSYFSESD